MPFVDFRQFLDVLRQHGELIDINRPVALNDVGKAMKQAYVRGGPAIMFNDNGTDYPLVAGIYANREKALLAFEAEEDTILDKVLHGLDNPISDLSLINSVKADIGFDQSLRLGRPTKQPAYRARACVSWRSI